MYLTLYVVCLIVIIIVGVASWYALEYWDELYNDYRKVIYGGEDLEKEP